MAALSYASGQVVETYDYDVYRAVKIYTDDGNDNIWLSGDETPASASICGNIYFFTVQQIDEETVLISIDPVPAAVQRQRQVGFWYTGG